MSELIATEWTYKGTGFKVVLSRFEQEYFGTKKNEIRYSASLKLDVFNYSIESEAQESADKALENLCEKTSQLTSALVAFENQISEMKTTIKHRLSHDTQFS